jgi:hypothetical protein
VECDLEMISMMTGAGCLLLSDRDAVEAAEGLAWLLAVAGVAVLLMLNPVELRSDSARDLDMP